VEGPEMMPHMPTTGVSGVDLYTFGENGESFRCAGKFHFGDTIVYRYNNLTYHIRHRQGYEYRLYLPLYNTVNTLEIGVKEGSFFKFLPTRPEKPIIIYGTSIAQGACASRPGMAWSNILERHLDIPVINLGFSGNGRLEKEVVNFINELDAQLYIIDCMPNLTPETEETIQQRLTETVQQIRSQHPHTPILLTEHSGYANAMTDTFQYHIYTQTNRAFQKAYRQLQELHTKALFYLPCDSIGMHPDAMVDDIHATDFGMMLYAKAYEKKIRQILKMPQGKLSTTKAVSQRREADGYEWKKRHHKILTLITSNPPETIIIGNSITHYWGGQPQAHIQRGIQSWNEYLTPLNSLNLGFGWDRIENMLWRIYHGELDGYQAKKVILLAGTNNLAYNNDKEIVTGIQLLVQAIRERQPTAQITVIGILPRQGMEKRIRELNPKIEKAIRQPQVHFEDAGRLLLTPQQLIDKTLFLDEVHPNTQGYEKIAPIIVH